MRKAIGPAVLVMLLGLAGSAQAQIWDLNDDADALTNPGGQWSFGFTNDDSDPTAFVAYTNSFVTGSGLRIWDDGGGPPHPNVAYNTTGGILEGHILPGMWNMHPGDDADGDYAKIRWTAPGSLDANTLIGVAGEFRLGAGGQNEFIILHNSTPILGPVVTLSNQVIQIPSFTVNPNDTIDFVVGNGGDGQINDATSVDFEIREVIPGDADGNTVVDTVDLQLILDNFLLNGDPSPAFAFNMVNDGIVDHKDYLVWVDNAPPAALAAAGLAVPEPLSLWMALFAGAGLMSVRRRSLRD